MTVSLAEIKAHLRVDSSDEDAYLVGLINAATSHAEAHTGTAIAQAQSVKKLPCFGNLGLTAPLISVDSVQYIDDDGATQTLDSDVYSAIGLWTTGNPNLMPYITLAYSQDWPSTRAVPEAVTVTYTSGYTSANVPDDIRAAICLLVGHLYENREETIVGVPITNIPMGFSALLSPYKVWRL